MNKLRLRGIASIAIVLIIVGILAVAIGGYFALVIKPGFVAPMQTPTPTPSNSVPTNATCDNYQCLISAASQCQPISATVSYSGLPHLFLPDVLTSGQTKYEIKKSSGMNSCTLIFSSPVTIFSISDKGRAAALAKGMTDAQITAQLQTMNDSMKSVAGSPTTCPSNASAISAYLTDMKDNDGLVKSESKSTSFGQSTTIFTTSSGQKLACTTVTVQAKK